MTQRQEGGKNVKKISEMSTEEQLNARRKGLSHKSRMKTGNIEKENKDRKEEMEKLGLKLFEMSIAEDKGESKKFYEMASKFEKYTDEDIDRYIASQEDYYFQLKTLPQMFQKPPGTKLNLDFPLGMPGMPELTVTEDMNEGSKLMKKKFGPTFDRECPDFCDEYCRTVGIPEGLDREWARKLLYRSFVDSRLLPWSMLGPWRVLGDETGYAKLELCNNIRCFSP